MTAPAYLWLDRYVWHYLMYSLLLLLLVTVTVVAFSFLPVVGDLFQAVVSAIGALTGMVGLQLLGGLAVMLLPGILVVLLVLSRLSLVLPAVALGQASTLRKAWRASRGNTLRLALATLLCVLPSAVLFVWELTTSVREWRADPVHRLARILVYPVLSSLAFAVLAIFAVTLLSLKYRFFTGGRGDSAPSA